MSSTDLDCPRCIKFGLLQPPPVTPATNVQPVVEIPHPHPPTPLAESLSPGSPTVIPSAPRKKWYDVTMLVLTALVVIAYHAYGDLVFVFYVLVILGYAFDGVVWLVRKTVRGVSRR